MAAKLELRQSQAPTRNCSPIPPGENLIVQEEKIAKLEIGRVFCNFLRQGYGLPINTLLFLLVTPPAIVLVIFRLFIVRWIDAPSAQQLLPEWKVQVAYLVGLVMLLGGVAGILLPTIFFSAGNSLHNAML